VGRLDLHRQAQLGPETDHTLLVFTATPGTPSHDALVLLGAVGHSSRATSTVAEASRRIAAVRLLGGNGMVHRESPSS
jgi:hypothetical protein